MIQNVSARRGTEKTKVIWYRKEGGRGGGGRKRITGFSRGGDSGGGTIQTSTVKKRKVSGEPLHWRKSKNAKMGGRKGETREAHIWEKPDK